MFEQRLEESEGMSCVGEVLQTGKSGAKVLRQEGAWYVGGTGAGVAGSEQDRLMLRAFLNFSKLINLKINTK